MGRVEGMSGGQQPRSAEQQRQRSPAAQQVDGDEARELNGDNQDGLQRRQNVSQAAAGMATGSGSAAIGNKKKEQEEKGERKQGKYDKIGRAHV